MTEKERILAAKFLRIASAEFSYHGCNDVDEELFNGWSLEERQQFVKQFHEYNGDPNEYDHNFLNLPDFAIMSFLSFKLTQSQ